MVALRCTLVLLLDAVLDGGLAVLSLGLELGHGASLSLQTHTLCQQSRSELLSFNARYETKHAPFSSAALTCCCSFSFSRF